MAGGNQIVAEPGGNLTGRERTPDQAHDETARDPILRAATGRPSRHGGVTKRCQRPAPGAAKSQAEQLFLSVFLNLMAFFAVLVAVSEFDAGRSTAAIMSIKQVFGEGSIPSDQGIGDPEALNGLQQGGARERLEGYVDRLAYLQRASVDIGSDRISVEFEPRELFAEPRAVLKADRNVLLVRLAALLSGSGSPWEVELFAVLPETRAEVGGVGWRSLVTARLAALAAGLAANDISPDRIRISLRSGGAEGDFRFGFELTQPRDRRPAASG